MFQSHQISSLKSKTNISSFIFDTRKFSFKSLKGEYENYVH